MADVAKAVGTRQSAAPLQGRVAEAETMGRAAGAYYRALIENGVPKPTALNCLRDWCVGGPAAPGEPHMPGSFA